MGFRPSPVLIKLNFRDSDLEGLEVTMRSVTIREHAELLRGQASVSSDLVESNEAYLAKFASKLVSWNLENPESGEPVPATREGVDSLESNVFTQISRAWQQALLTVPPTSPAPSQNGAAPGISLEESLGLGSASILPPG